MKWKKKKQKGASYMKKTMFALVLGIYVTTMGGHAMAVSSMISEELGKNVNLPSQVPQDTGRTDRFYLVEEIPGSTLIVITHFPQQLSPAVDKALMPIARDRHFEAYEDVVERSEFALEKALEEVSTSDADEKAKSPKKPDWSTVYADVTTYSLYPLTSGYVSILFRTDMTGAAAHSNWIYEAHCLALSDAMPVGLGDLFPGQESPASALVPLILAKLPEEMRGLDEHALDISMKRIVLTQTGIRVVYAPYEIGSFSQGEFICDLPLDELAKAGADLRFWPK